MATAARSKSLFRRRAVVYQNSAGLELGLKRHEFVYRHLSEGPIQPSGQRIYGRRLSARRFIDHAPSVHW